MLIWVCLHCLLLTSTFTSAKVLHLDKSLLISWKTDEEVATINIKADIGTQDWVGVGFSDYGSLPGADLCVFWRDWTGQIFFTDVSVTADGLIKEDTINHCHGMKWRPRGRRSKKNNLRNISELKSVPSIEYVYQRKLWTCDKESYRIEDGTTHVVWAVGLGPLYKLDGLNITSSFNVRTGMSRTRFINVQTKPDPRAEPLVFTNHNLSISSEDTTYFCSVFKLPNIFNRKHHITEYGAEISTGNEDVVHHMELFHCQDEQEFPLWTGECGDKNAPEILKRCKKVLAAWAIGAGPFLYPADAGLAIGGPGFSPYVMLEIHYNNPLRREGIIDSSGLKFKISKELRKYDAGILELGLEYNNKMAVPPEMKEFVLTGSCVQECTAVSLPKSGIVIFGSQLHTHGAGKRVETTLVRGGREYIVNIDKHYSTHFQEIRELMKPVHVLPGDSLLTSCLYSTLDRENITLGGFGFTEEMCVNYVHYYPKVQLEVCKSSVDTDDLFEYFEKLNQDEGEETTKDKSIEENYRSIRWNKKRSADLGTLYTQGTLSMQCMRGTGEPFPGTWNQVPQVKVVEPFKADTDKCANNYKNLPREEKRNLKKKSSDDDLSYIPLMKRDEPRMKKMEHDHNHMQKRLFNKYADTWEDYGFWGIDKRNQDDLAERVQEDDFDDEEYFDNLDVVENPYLETYDQYDDLFSSKKRMLGSM